MSGSGNETLIGGPKEARIVLVESSALWTQRFEEERAKISRALGDRAISIDHVGSTSVPGLAAKPIIDICLTVADSAEEGEYLAALTAIGFRLRVREPDFFEHRMLRPLARDVHLHLFSLGCREITWYLVFRDWLRLNQSDRALYESTKRRLATMEWPTMQHYADAKSAVILEIMGRALRTAPPR